MFSVSSGFLFPLPKDNSHSHLVVFYIRESALQLATPSFSSLSLDPSWWQMHEARGSSSRHVRQRAFVNVSFSSPPTWQQWTAMAVKPSGLWNLALSLLLPSMFSMSSSRAKGREAAYMMLYSSYCVEIVQDHKTISLLKSPEGRYWYHKTSPTNESIDTNHVMLACREGELNTPPMRKVA